MPHAICIGLPALLHSAASCCLALALIGALPNDLRAGVVPNTDSPQPDNGANDPYYINSGASLTYVNVFNDDTLVVNGGTISNQSRPAQYWRSAIRMFDDSRTIINGGLIRDVDPEFTTYALELEDRSRLTVNGGTFYQSGGSGVSALLYASNSSIATVNGGDFHSVHNPAVETWMGGSVTINGGTFASDQDEVVNIPSGSVTIKGGAFSGPEEGVRVIGGYLALRGGQFNANPDLLVARGGTELFARSASIGGSPLVGGLITVTDGVIELVWPNGAAESLKFEQSVVGSIRLTLVPEPSTIASGPLAGAALLAAAQRNRRRLAHEPRLPAATPDK